MEKEKINIPEELVQICRELAKVAQSNGLYSLQGEFRHPFEWGSSVGFKWEAGRHNEDAGEITVWSNLQVITRVNNY